MTGESPYDDLLIKVLSFVNNSSNSLSLFDFFDLDFLYGESDVGGLFIITSSILILGPSSSILAIVGLTDSIVGFEGLLD